MKKSLLLLVILISTNAFCQVKKTSLFGLVKLFVQSDENSTGDWAVGKPAAYPVQWEADRIVMSDDEKINFYRKGTVNFGATGNIFFGTGSSVMLKGARSGYSSFTITGLLYKSTGTKPVIDSLFGKNIFTYKLAQACDGNAEKGFYYYEVNIPGRIPAFIKISWQCNSGNCIATLDAYDSWSKQYATLQCPVK